MCYHMAPGILVGGIEFETSVACLLASLLFCGAYTDMGSGLCSHRGKARVG